MTAQETLLVGGLLVGGSILPAAKQDSLPFVGERAHGGMVIELVHLALVIIEGSRPFAGSNGLTGILVESLTQEFRATPAKVNPLGVAAADRDRRDARIGLEILDSVPAIAAGTKGDQQSW